MLLLTGGAGFIGSNLAASLECAGHRDIVICDDLGSDGKWRNLAKRTLRDVVPIRDLASWMPGRKLDAVVHMGAISSTTAVDGDIVMEMNFRSSVRLLDWCTDSRVPFVYASSAATYGDGDAGFGDGWSPERLASLRPMNLYGWSKHLFDRLVSGRHARGEPMPPIWGGLKFFNVYGPNEYHKGGMASVLSKVFDEARDGKGVRLFRSHREGVGDGEQARDFIHVDDICSVVAWILSKKSFGGIHNVGTGQARTFRDMMLAMYSCLGVEPRIEYVDMPESIRGAYQYRTEGRPDGLWEAGYPGQFTTLEDGVARYVDVLASNDRFR